MDLLLFALGDLTESLFDLILLLQLCPDVAAISVIRCADLWFNIPLVAQSSDTQDF